MGPEELQRQDFDIAEGARLAVLGRSADWASL